MPKFLETSVLRNFAHFVNKDWVTRSKQEYSLQYLKKEKVVNPGRPSLIWGEGRVKNLTL